MSRVVVKVGSSSVTTPAGTANTALLERLGAEVAGLLAHHEVVVVSSGAIALGWSQVGAGRPRPRDTAVLQAVSAVGQHLLMAAWQESFARVGRTCGQVLLGSLDFGHRRQYLHARGTLGHLLELGVIPVVNENDATSDDEIRFGDNDRLAALVAQAVGANHLVLLTDTEGLYTSDPRLEASASLIEVVTEIDAAISEGATGSRSGVGSGGMASKLAAAKIATFSGIEVVIGHAERAGVLTAAVDGVGKVGTRLEARPTTLPARTAWIAFALPARGTVVLDPGAAAAVLERGRSLLLAGVASVEGTFEVGDAVELHDALGLLAKGLVQLSSDDARRLVGRRSTEVEPGTIVELCHRDDLVILR